MMKKPLESLGPTFALKDGEGAFQNVTVVIFGTVMEADLIYGNKKAYTYAYFKVSDSVLAEYMEYSLDVKSEGNYTYYAVEKAKLNGENSYLYFSNEVVLENFGEDYYKCGIRKPGRYSGNDIKSKCGSDIENDIVDAYIFKISEDDEFAYNVTKKELVSIESVSTENRHAVKTYEEINEIIKEITEKYPKSASAVLPSVLIVIGLLSLLI